MKRRDFPRARDLWSIPLTLIALALYPVLVLFDLPNDTRWTRLERRKLAWRDRDALDLTTVVRVRRWTREFYSMASGYEELELCELELFDGTTVVVEPDARIYRELRMPPATSLGRAVSGLVGIAWLWIVVPIMAVIMIMC